MVNFWMDNKVGYKMKAFYITPKEFALKAMGISEQDMVCWNCKHWVGNYPHGFICHKNKKIKHITQQACELLEIN